MKIARILKAAYLTAKIPKRSESAFQNKNYCPFDLPFWLAGSVRRNAIFVNFRFPIRSQTKLVDAVDNSTPTGGQSETQGIGHGLFVDPLIFANCLHATDTLLELRVNLLRQTINEQ